MNSYQDTITANQIRTQQLAVFNTDTTTICSHTSVASNASIFIHLDLPITSTITLGSYTFKADQLGELLSLLLSQHPELSI